jgi:hypothetical protein
MGDSEAPHDPRYPNLKPSKPGEVRNPKGINQYTYRRDFEASIDKLLRSPMADTLTEPKDQTQPCAYCGGEAADALLDHTLYVHRDCSERFTKMTRGEVLAHTTMRRAMAGEIKMLPEVLKRLWAPVEKHEVSGPDGGQVTFSWKPAAPPCEPRS